MARTAALLAAALLAGLRRSRSCGRGARCSARSCRQQTTTQRRRRARLGLRLLVKFSDGLAIRGGSGGVRSELEGSRGHVSAINRIVAKLGAAAVSRCSPRSGIDGRRSCGRSALRPRAAHLLSARSASTGTASRPWSCRRGRGIRRAAERRVRGDRPRCSRRPCAWATRARCRRRSPTARLRDADSRSRRRRPTTRRRSCTRGRSLRRRLEPGGAADGRDVRYSDCEYCWCRGRGRGEMTGKATPATRTCSPTTEPPPSASRPAYRTQSGFRRGAGDSCFHPLRVDAGGRAGARGAAAVADWRLATSCCSRCRRPAAAARRSPCRDVAGDLVSRAPGADAGVVVVAAAGNGDEDPDSEPYEEPGAWRLRCDHRGRH